nr:Glutathione synthase/Ribosomal protein S6 modification enzyme (glutaminyl transferase) [Kibdelosporangium sp. MJ126-NF4]CTQ90289.1 Glutathione synthase/Ribosomal protein S6 modification enzyme (glutaminyl transferase) [Kibdelosporangium sp. MJ126-NF4]
MDPVGSAAAAEYKLLQLAVATRLGADVPETLVTNNPARAAQFRKRGATVVKPLSAASARMLPFVGRLTEDLVPAVRTLPSMLQREVEAVADVRILVCGRQVLSWRRPTTEGAGPDWRQHDPHGSEFRLVDVDPRIADLSAKIVAALRLSTAVLDWLVDRNGKYWFLESNPQGAWLFLPDADSLGVALYGRHLIGAKDG